MKTLGHREGNNTHWARWEDGGTGRGEKAVGRGRWGEIIPGEKCLM